MNVELSTAITNQALLQLKRHVTNLGGKWELTGLPEPEVIPEYNQTSEVMREIYHNTNQLTNFIDNNEPRLVDEQISAYNNNVY